MVSIRSEEGQPPGMFRSAGDYLLAAAVVMSALSLFWLDWMKAGISTGALGIDLGTTWIRTLRLTDTPWYWFVLLVLILLPAIASLFLPRLQGLPPVVSGVLFVMFGVLFLFGVWYRINGIIGDLAALIRAVPYVGNLLGDAFTGLTRRMVQVELQPGYYLFLCSGLLMVAGGLARFLARGSGGAPETVLPGEG